MWDPSLWYHEGIDYAVSHGLMKGVSANRFNPNGSTSRAMVVTVLYRLAGEPAVSGSAAFRDVVPGAWYEKAVIWASTNGVVNGFADGTFAPDASITRQQLAAILWRYAGSPTASGGLSAFADAAEVSAFALDAMVWVVGQDILLGDNGKLLPRGATAHSWPPCSSASRKSISKPPSASAKRSPPRAGTAGFASRMSASPKNPPFAAARS